MESLHGFLYGKTTLSDSQKFSYTQSLGIGIASMLLCQ